PRVDEKEDADRKNEDERADEQPEIEVQISSQPIKSPFHLAGILSRQQGMSTAFRTGSVAQRSLKFALLHFDSLLRVKCRSTLRHASTSLQFVFGEGLDGQGQELREEWVVCFVGFAQF